MLTDFVAAIGTTATGQTVSPVRTVNSKAEALITFGGNLSANDTLTIGNSTYTFKAALTEAKATATLTNDATDAANTSTVTIDGVVYTFKSALTEVKATGTLTNDGTQPADGSSVVIGSKTYTFQATLTNVDGNVHIGGTNLVTMTNLFHAINASGGAVGTDYATLTTAHPTVTATNPTGTTLVATAKTAGIAGNSIATTASTSPNSHGTWAFATLTGGVASVANEVLRGVSNTASMTSLFEAITAGANAGTDYSSATVAHPTVTATNPTGTTVVATAKSVGVAGNSIAVSASTSPNSHATWNTPTLLGGVDAIANQIFIDDTAAHTRDNVMNAITLGAGQGTKYSNATVAHDKVTAAASSGNLLVTALSAANVTPGLSVRLAKSATNLTLPTLAQLDGPGWTATGHAFTDGEGPVLITNAGGALPAGTLTTDLYVHKIDANTVAFASSREAARKGDFLQTTDAGSGTQTAKRRQDARGFFELLDKNNPRTVAAATDIDNLK